MPKHLPRGADPLPEHKPAHGRGVVVKVLLLSADEDRLESMRHLLKAPTRQITGEPAYSLREAFDQFSG